MANLVLYTHRVWAVAISGWVVALAVLWWTKRGTARPNTETEAQLQQTMREFAKGRKSWATEKDNIEEQHRAQMDAVRASAVEFEFEADGADPAAVKQLVDDILSKTKTRGERG